MLGLAAGGANEPNQVASLHCITDDLTSGPDTSGRAKAASTG